MKTQNRPLSTILDSYDLMIDNTLFVFQKSVERAPQSADENRQATLATIRSIIAERDKTIEIFSK